MSNYINQVSDSLKNHISELANNPCLFLRNPNVDFSRKRKIDLFKSFTDDNLPTTNNYHGYRLIACDGSNLTIATNQKNPETFWERNLSFEMGNRNFIQRIKICHRINKFPCTKTRFY